MTTNNKTDFAEKSAKKVRGKPFSPGKDARRNENGRPRGSLNYETKMRIALEKLSQEMGKNCEELEVTLYKMGLKRAIEGDFPFFKDFMDRVHGRPTQHVETDFAGELKIDALKQLQETTRKILGG